jgi:hypothetical protein
MQDPNEDTEWNDILRAKGIIPEKEKKDVTEDDIVSMLEDTIRKKTGEKNLDEMDLDELDELEDEEEEKILLQMRQQRISEIKAKMEKSRFGEVREITAVDYVQEVNKAGEGIMVVLHLYKQGIPLCALINEYMNRLAPRFPQTKFLKAIASTCIPNYPDKNLPTIFVYFGGTLKAQMVGPLELRGVKLTEQEFEYLLGKTDAIDTKIKEDPKPKVKDVMFSSLRNQVDDLADEGDW